MSSKLHGKRVYYKLSLLTGGKLDYYTVWGCFFKNTDECRVTHVDDSLTH